MYMQSNNFDCRLPVMAAKWLSPQRMDETFTVGLNSDLPKNVAGTLSGIADSESFGPFPRIPKPQTNTSPSSTEIGLFNLIHKHCKEKIIQRSNLCFSTVKYSNIIINYDNDKPCNHFVFYICNKIWINSY